MFDPGPLDGVWLRGGTRFSVPAWRDDSPPLLSLDVTRPEPPVGAAAASAPDPEIEQLVVFGRAHHRERPLAARTLGGPGCAFSRTLERNTLLCPGVPDPERVEHAEHDLVAGTLGQGYVVEQLDGKAVHAFNQHVSELGGFRRWTSHVHDQSATAMATVRADTCRLTIHAAEAGSSFNPQCSACCKLSDILRRRLNKRSSTSSSDQSAKRAASSWHGTKDSHLTREDLVAKAQERRQTIKGLRRTVKLLKAASFLRETQGHVLAPGDAADFCAMLLDKGVQKAAQEDLGGGEKPVLAALLEDQQKYARLKDKRGMRWHPAVLKWVLLFYTRSNTGAWDQLRSLIQLPSGRTLRGYTEQLKTGGFNREALARIALRIVQTEQREMKKLIERQSRELAAFSDRVEPSCSSQLGLIEAGRERLWQYRLLRQEHADARSVLQAQHEWDRMGTISFDTMKASGKILWNSKTMELTGLEDLFGVETDEFDLNRMLEGVDHQLGGELQVFWFVSFGKVKLSFALGHFALSKPTTTLLLGLWREAVRFAQEVGGLAPVYGVCDGASENEKMTKALCTHSSNPFGVKDHYIDPFSNRKVFMGQCQTHLVIIVLAVAGNFWL